jgi:hypothetical protein
MKIVKASTIGLNHKVRIVNRVALHKSDDMFGDCDGIRVWFQQDLKGDGLVDFVDIILSPTEALNLSNRLGAAFDQISDMELARSRLARKAAADPFPGL